MTWSIFSIFKPGIGPSSSHTMGPMRAARAFTGELQEKNLLQKTAAVQIDLHGSLALTGRGHGIDGALLMGLEGADPALVDPVHMAGRVHAIQRGAPLKLADGPELPFRIDQDILLHEESLPRHPNGMVFTARGGSGGILLRSVWFSTGGGFILHGDENPRSEKRPDLPWDFRTADQLIRVAEKSGLTAATLARQNEEAVQDGAAVQEGLRRIYREMNDCIDRGCRTEGVLPGGLQVRRRAPGIYRALMARTGKKSSGDPLQVMDQINLFALAVCEENAAGSRMVTAPTNGAAGIVPAVMRYLDLFCPGGGSGVDDYLLTAGTIGILFACNASISGAEVGCQGEVGVAASMAAAGLAAARGGTIRQVTQAAEIAMEHSLGLTCDPVGGLVQIPCIERNAMGAAKAINAARIALQGDGEHHISLDAVMRTMMETGRDMQSRYKETSRGGLAVNYTEC